MKWLLWIFGIIFIQVGKMLLENNALFIAGLVVSIAGYLLIVSWILVTYIFRAKKPEEEKEVEVQ